MPLRFASARRRVLSVQAGLLASTLALTFCKSVQRDPGTVVGYTEITRSEIARAEAGAPDALPSWRDGDAKRAIVAFVIRATTPGADWVPDAQRVAVFDDDGTLWPEHPPIELEFARARLDGLAMQDPDLRGRQPFKAALERDDDYFLREGASKVSPLLDLVGAAQTNMTEDEYQGRLAAFFTNAIHPRFGVPFGRLAYAPMLELVRWLRERGFRVHVCSTGEIDFVRALAARTYGVEPEDVTGSSFEKAVVPSEGGTTLYRRDVLRTINDEASKPANLDLHLGQRPVLAVSNLRNGRGSAILEWTRGRLGPSLGVVVVHDDVEREGPGSVAVDAATFDLAARAGYTVVSMRRDFAALVTPVTVAKTSP